MTAKQTWQGHILAVQPRIRLLLLPFGKLRTVLHGLLCATGDEKQNADSRRNSRFSQILSV